MIAVLVSEWLLDGFNGLKHRMGEPGHLGPILCFVSGLQSAVGEVSSLLCALFCTHLDCNVIVLWACLDVLKFIQITIRVRGST